MVVVVLTRFQSRNRGSCRFKRLGQLSRRDRYLQKRFNLVIEVLVVSSVIIRMPEYLQTSHVSIS